MTPIYGVCGIPKYMARFQVSTPEFSFPLEHSSHRGSQQVGLTPRRGANAIAVKNLLAAKASSMRPAHRHRVAVAVILYVVLGSDFDGEYMSSIAESAHRRRRVRCKRRALYEDVLASLINDKCASEAELLVLDPPPFVPCICPR